MNSIFLKEYALLVKYINDFYNVDIVSNPSDYIFIKNIFLELANDNVISVYKELNYANTPIAPKFESDKTNYITTENCLVVMDVLYIIDNLYKDEDINHKIELDKFDKCFLNVAKCISELSKDPSSKIGAVITGKNKQIISQGFNGFPRGVDDTEERYNDKPTKYSLVVHAEANAIYNALANGSTLEDSTIYVYGLSVCNECAKAIIQTGIKKVVQLNLKPNNPNWTESCKISDLMFKESGVEVVSVTLKELE